MKNEIKKIVELIKKNDKVALFGHKKPDPDSISCSYGLALAIKETFPKKKVFFVGDYQYLTKHFKGINFDQKMFKNKITNDYLTITGDGALDLRIEFYEQYAKGKDKIAFDHHQNDTNLDVNVFWHEPNYPASALQACEIAFALKSNFSEETSFVLSLGLLSDTGHFVFSKANEKPVKMYGKLLENISDNKMDFYFKESRQKSLAFIKAAQFLLANVKFDGQVSYVIVSKRNLKKYGEFYLKLNIHIIGNIENYPIWTLVFEKDGETKYEVHLRSNGPSVNKVALNHHGGGHIRASGAKAYSKNELKDLLNELNQV